MSAFAHLLALGRFGAMELRKRIVRTAIGLSMAKDDGNCGERLIRYQEDQARGGVGLIISGVAGVAWPVGRVQLKQIAISDELFCTACASHQGAARCAGKA